MARGWESKDVESQKEEREARQRETPPPTETEKRRQSLELSRTALRGDLERARHPRHREQLEAALRHLEAEIAKLTPGD